MKALYKSPVITVEELYKKDVLCESGLEPQPVVDPVQENNSANGYGIGL